MRNIILSTSVLIGLAPFFCTSTALAEGKSADEVAKELSNPAGSLASLTFNLQYDEYTGDLPKSDDEESTSLIFQPVLPFPVGDKGRRIIFRPALAVLFDQPLFDPAKQDFDAADTEFADIGFDLFLAATEMTNKKEKKGYLWGAGMAGTLPTASSDDVGGDQWRFGPQLFGGVIRHWGLAGALVNHQWDAGGSNDETYSTTTALYFYAISLGGGWQIASSPSIIYDWEADSDDALTLPLGVGMSRTTSFGKQHWKFQLQVQKFVEQPDTFGPDWLVKFSATPVIVNPFLSLF